MKTIRCALCILAMIAVSISSCKKEDEVKTKTDLLTGNYWKMSAWTIVPGFPIYNDSLVIIGYTNDLFDLMLECSLDDILKYNSNGTVIWDEGPSKCYQDDPQTTQSTWAFDSTETEITEVDSYGISYTYKILELSESILKIKYSSDQFEGDIYIMTITFEPANNL